MMVIVGWIIAVVGVFGGFAIAGGHLASLFQPVELLMIGGGALGAFVAANGGKGMKAFMSAFPRVFKGSKYTKAFYMELLALLFEILSKVRREGLMSIEADVEKPEESPLFSKYPAIQSNHHLVEFIADYLRLMVGGNLNAMEIENLMDAEIETHHHEGMGPAHSVQRMADAMPAFGIVAAVMGVVHTMESLHLPPTELGVLIAHALVGTFLGILLSYGFVSPVSTAMETKVEEDGKALQTVKTVILASLNGFSPQVCIEFGRKVLNSTERPGFFELEEDIKARKAAK